MTAATGQTLRRLGLLIEAVTMLTLLSLWRGNAEFLKGSRVDPATVLMAVFGLGLVMWVVGTETIRRAAMRESRGSRSG